MLRQCDISGNGYAVRAARGTDECLFWTQRSSCLLSILTKYTGFISLRTDYCLQSARAADLLNVCIYQSKAEGAGRVVNSNPNKNDFPSTKYLQLTSTSDIDSAQSIWLGKTLLWLN